MAYINTVPVELAAGKLKEIYTDQLNNLGYVPNYTQAFSPRPEVIAAWNTLMGTIRSKMRLRRYELITFAAALALRCTY